MKIIHFRIFIFPILLLVLQACEKDVTDKLGASTSGQLVITAFISPQDTALTVGLQRTQPVIGTQHNTNDLQVKDAVVKLSDGNQEIRLNYNEKTDSYHAKKELLPITAGKTYTLNVTTPGGWNATATTTVPLATNVFITTYQLTVKEHGSALSNKLNFKWQDDNGIDNYYRAYAYRQNNSGSAASIQGFNIENELDSYFTDKGLDGQELVSGDGELFSSRPDDFTKPYKLHLLVLVTDKNYYLYHRSVIQQRNADDNPFAEPVLLYTNITGGLGVFASYNIVKDIRTVN